MINTVNIIGRTTKEMELKELNSGNKVVNFTVACERSFKINGEKVTDFIPVIAWNKTAELIAEYVEKGDLVAVRGMIQTRSYENSEGRTVYVTEVRADEVQFLTYKNNNNNSNEEYNPFEDDNEDVPF